MLITRTSQYDPEFWPPGHCCHTQECQTRAFVTLRTWCGCRMNRSLRKDRVKRADAGLVEDVREAHRAARETHLAGVDARRDEGRKALAARLKGRKG